ncbi:hypothetical protein GLOTRDRAFT_139298 [Gloeophyllum trabeum ATCC 11539]|uniref:F-box domain-containing protein n=1 Tax=Gloeophyllum trabeum (strain ATCC 11539 / FP-39264 / Madison 617) TaxID=670483 RepID=S7RK89_GLOTA|nr:uncharacterized protein GLOTRDRAFT_139298 [Gloeophyllum trabeum ATCC 11539]EPQ54810.1 hypothetical protein GLOTRDRAFT_139298 [Gloeophyllum trabeum ATCC 11539]
MAEPRKSSRLRTKNSQAAAADKENVSTATGPPHKRARKKAADDGQKAGKGKRKSTGKLRVLLEMPLDVLYEIFGSLHPLDLLRLSWTSREFRRVLMNRSARTVWIRSLKSVEGMPECPEDVTEPQWARLAFYPSCHYCGAMNCQTVVWSCRVRCCNKCMKEYFVDSKHPIFKPLIQVWRDHLHTWIPSHYIFSKEKHVYLKSEAEAFVRRVHPRPSWGALKAILKEREEIVIPLYEHAEECDEWFEEEKEKRALELDEVRSARRQAVVAKLYEAGYGEELTALMNYDIDSFMDHPLVSQPKELTERIWNNIQGPLIKWMEEKKLQRLEHDRIEAMLMRDAMAADLYEEWLRTQSPVEAYPSIADVLLMKEFNDIILQPADIDVTAADFAPAMGALPRLVEEWREKTGLKLCELMSREEGQDEEALNVPRRLELATTIFRCTSCRDFINYPRALSHKCLTRPRYANPKRGYCAKEAGEKQSDLMLRWGTLEHEPWNYDGNGLLFADKASDLVKQLVESCGLDPDTTTREEMNERNDRFACMTCVTGGSRPHTVMSWNTAVEHRLRDHAELEDFKGFVHLTPQDARHARELERPRGFVPFEWMDNRPGIHPMYWHCTFCRENILETRQAGLVAHMQGHGVGADADMRQYLYNHPDAPAYWCPVPIKMKVKETPVPTL